MSGCRQSLCKARDAQAAKYSPVLFAEAQRQWDQALSLWKRENRKWMIGRNLNTAKACADSGIEAAREAALGARAAKDSFQTVASIRIAALQQEVCDIQTKYGRLPIDRPLRIMLAESELLLSQSKSACARQDFDSAAVKSSRALSLCSRVGSETSTMVDQYLARIPRWETWVHSAVSMTKGKKMPAVVIIKMARLCRIYAHGRVRAEYRAEFGPNWMQHKRARGDDATPEGNYRVIRKKSKGQTKYGWALEINYPNDEDRRRFAEAKSRGEVPATADIGGLIEIHGGGGKAADWTDGCIALKDGDMATLFSMVPVGTPVIIVGALSGTTQPDW